jgi:hypothetical protein
MKLKMYYVLIKRKKQQTYSDLNVRYQSKI